MNSRFEIIRSTGIIHIIELNHIKFNILILIYLYDKTINVLKINQVNTEPIHNK